MFFDEFAVYDRPSLFYGWAERNTRPEVNSDESTRHKLNGFLCVDALTGEEFFRLSPHAKTEDISLYLAELCLECVELGVSKLCIILDNNPTHQHSYAASVGDPFAADGISSGDNAGISLYATLFTQAELGGVYNSFTALALPASFAFRHHFGTD